jgi:trehalose-6-phosphatase
MQISAILSDYDGTLCPTGTIRNQEENLIPADLEAILWSISENIPVCIVSSKDFDFLHNNLLMSFHVFWALKCWF